MKKWSLAAVVLAIAGLVLAATFTAAQDQPPAPYAGMKNPFAWNDAQAQAAGKTIYTQNCVGCHGPAGKGIASFDFSQPDYAKGIEARPDYHFWVVSEGRLSKGMPAYKSSLSEDQRWQVLTYIWSLGSQPATPAPTTSPAAGGSISVTSSSPPTTGQEATFTAVVKDTQGKPLAGVPVTFYLGEDFFAKGLMEIGKATTDSNGEAKLTYVPTISGDQTVTVKSSSAEGSANFAISGTQEEYQSTAGLQLNPPGPDILVGPPGAKQLDQNGDAPATALRLPGGILSLLWLYIGLIVLIWGTYFVIMYQVLGIARHGPVTVRGLSRGPNVRSVPAIALLAITALGLLMIFMIITGPYSHFHLVP